MSTFRKRNASLAFRRARMTRLLPNVTARTAERGFSLIELMIATFILGVGVLSVATMIGTSISRNLSSKNDSSAARA